MRHAGFALTAFVFAAACSDGARAVVVDAAPRAAVVQTVGDAAVMAAATVDASVMVANVEPKPTTEPCVAIPTAHTEVANDKVTWKATTHRVNLDLDGAGSATYLVPVVQAGKVPTPGEIHWTIYVVRAGAAARCGRAVGKVQGLNDPYLDDGSSHGLRNLATLRPNDHVRPGRSGNLLLQHYAFDGAAYVPNGPPEQR